MTFSEITEPAIREAFAHPRRDRPRPRRRPAGPADRRPARRLHAQPAALAQGPLGPLRRARPVGRRPARRRPRARDPRLRRADEYWTIEATPRDAPAGTTFPAELVRIDGEKPAIGDAATARPAHVEAIRASRPVVALGRRQALEAEPGAAVHHLDAPAGGEPQARLQPASGRCRVAQRLYEGVELPEGQVGLITYMRTDSVALVGPGDGRGARGHRRRATARRTRCRRAAPFRTKTQQRPGGARGDPADVVRARPRRRWPAASSRDEARLYRLIWQRAIASQMKEKELETTTVELAAGRTSSGRRATRTVFDGFSRGLHRGPDDAAEEAERTLPALAEGDVTDGRRRHRRPALHRAAAALHRGDPDQGARGARHRPAVDLRRDDLDDPRPRLRDGQGAAPPPRAGRRGRDRPARRALRRVRRPRLHRADGGGARRGRPRRARRGCRSCATFYGPLKERVDEKRDGPPPARLHDRADRRGLLARSPDGDPPRPERPVPRLLALPRAQGDAAAARARRPDAAGACPASARRARQCGATDGGTLVAKRGRFGPFVGCDRYPDCDYIKKDGPPPPEPLPFEVVCPTLRRGPPRRPARAADRDRSSGAARATRSATSRPRTSRSGRPTTPTAGPVARKGEDGGDVPRVRRDDRPAGDGASIVPGRRSSADRPTRRRSPGPRRGGRGAARAAVASGGPAGGATAGDGAASGRGTAGRSAEPSARAGGVTGSRTPSTASSARSPPGTPRPTPARSYAHRGRRLPRLARRARRSTGADRRATELRAYLDVADRRATRGRRSPSASRRSARSTGSRRAHELSRRRPVGRDRDAAPAARLPQVLEIEQVEALLAAVDVERGRRGGRHEPCARADRRARPARPGARRDRLRGGPPDQRARRGRRSARSTCGAARSASSARGARSGSGCSAGRRARRSPTYLATAGRPPRPRAGRTAGRRRCRPRSSSTTAATPLGVRGLRFRLDRLCRAGRPARSASRRTRCVTASRPTCSTAARTCGSSRSCSATRASRRPRSTPTSRRTRLRAAYHDAHPRARAPRRDRRDRPRALAGPGRR